MPKSSPEGYLNVPWSDHWAREKRMRTTPSSEFPDLDALTAALTSTLQKNARDRRGLTVVARRPSPRASTFPSEVVTCRTDRGKTFRLHCKYASGYVHTGRDPRQGIAYEVEVYRSVLKPLKAATPHFYGTHTDPKTGFAWLMLEYLENSVPVSYTRNSESFLNAAARWAGRFHAMTAAKLKDHSFPFLVRFGADYYIRCARRTLLFASGLRSRYPWLRILCCRYQELVELLLHPLAIIHGEFEISNLLTRNRKIYPVDWEMAAIAAGEIDLANLTTDWPEATIRKCEHEYQRARWPQGPPPEFEKRLGAARLHYHFRWLSGRRDWTIHRSSSDWFKGLRFVGEQLGLI